MNYIKANQYDPQYVRELSMGPNPVKLLEELLALQPLAAGQTLLDLGCGMGLTSMFLAREYGQRVFAADLWISPTDNWQRFQAQGLDQGQIIPLKAEAHDLPFAAAFFDAIISVDSYHYYGLEPGYLARHLLPLVKPGGYLLFAVPGLKRDIHDNIPEEMLLSWTAEDIATLHDAAYWRQILSAAPEAEILRIEEMAGYRECWDDWLASDNEYAKKDRRAMEAGAGKYMNFLAMTLRRRNG